MPVCTFSGKEIPKGTGLMYVKKDGKILWFANKKAEINMLKLKRNKRKVKWTVEAHNLKKMSKKSAKQ